MGTQGQPPPQLPVLLIPLLIMKMTLVLIAIAATMAAAAPASKQSTEYCVSQWWPLQCQAENSGDCAGGWDRYDTMEACMGQTEPTGDFCVTNWWPYTCGYTGSGSSDFPSVDESACVSWDRYATPQECGQISPNNGEECHFGGYKSESADKGYYMMNYCVTSWYPATCEMMADAQGSNCEGWFPVDGEYCGWEDATCGGQIFEDTDIDSDSDSDYEDWCVTSWWPLECECMGPGCPSFGYAKSADKMTSQCVGISHHDNEAACCGGEAGCDAYPQMYGYCIASWTGSPSGGVQCTTMDACYYDKGLTECLECLPNTWFPIGGYSSESECEGTVKSESTFNVERQIEALKRYDVQEAVKAMLA